MYVRFLPLLDLASSAGLAPPVAIGCPVFVPPKDGVVEQIGNSIIVTCNHTRERSYLRCNGKTWVGELRNCSPTDGESV